MLFLKKLFGRKKQIETIQLDQLPWIEAAANQWSIRLLDLRPVTQTMTSTSSDQQMAINAVSYNRENGTSFWGHSPEQDKEIQANISFRTDGPLPPGVLFTPRVMEHKWAIYFDGENLLFVRSWLRKVFVVAKTRQTDNELVIERIRGEFMTDGSTDITISMLRYLLISHACGEIVPARLPTELSNDLQKAGLWAFSVYGRMAHFGTFDKKFTPTSQKPLRSQSLLHIAVVKNQVEEIERQVQNGIRLDYWATDGLAPLHWSIVANGTTSLEKLLALGADPDVVSTEGATPIMNAVQSNKIGHLIKLLEAGATINAIDNRGFTALHRAAEKGYEEIVEVLLKNGADKTIVGQGHTALSFAQSNGHQNIVALLS